YSREPRRRRVHAATRWLAYRGLVRWISDGSGSACGKEAAVRRQSLALIGLVLLGLGVLGGCAPASAPSAAPSGAAASEAAAGAVGAAARPAQPPERLRMSYAGLSAHFASGWVAQEAGLFDKY